MVYLRVESWLWDWFLRFVIDDFLLEREWQKDEQKKEENGNMEADDAKDVVKDYTLGQESCKKEEANE